MKNLMTNLCLGSVFATCALSPQTGAVANAADNNVTLDARYASLPVYRGDDLGLTFSGNEAKFRVWSPEAEAVKLRIYKNARGGDAMETLDMQKAENGTWVASLSPAPFGKFLSLIHI